MMMIPMIYDLNLEKFGGKMIKKNILAVFVLILFQCFFHNTQALCNQNSKIIFQVNSKTAMISKNNEEKKIVVDFPVVIKNGRSFVQTAFFSDFWDFGNGFTSTFDPVKKEVAFYFADEEGNRLVIVKNYSKNIGKAYFNDKEVFIDVAPFQYTPDNKYINVVDFALPIRLIFESFGYTVDWNNETREITAYK